jgi:hypothetical protein
VSCSTGREVDVGDDIDALKLIGVGPDEWQVSQLPSLHSADDGGSFVELPRGCWVRLNGVFGDQLFLSSQDMHPHLVADDNEEPYSFSGRVNSDAIVYSISWD